MRLTQTDCSFDEDDADYYVKGTYVAISISIALSVLVTAMSYFTWKYSWNKTVHPLNYEAVLSVADCIVYVILGIEVLQFLALAPGLHVIDRGLTQFFAVFLIDLFELKALKENDYFVKLNLFLCLTVLWIASSSLLLVKLRKDIKSLTVVEHTLLNVTYFMTHVATLPFTAAFIEIYVCDVEDGGDVYLRQDCNIECWAAQQAGYFTVSMVAIIIFTGLSMIQTPLWQEHASNLHVKVQPSSALIRFAMQFFLLSFKRALESGQLLGYAIIYTFAISIWAIYSFRQRPYNYIRASMWSFAGQVSCIWVGLLLIAAHGGARGIYLNVILGIGWSFIVGFTLHRQHYHLPSFLTFPKAELQEAKKPRIDESKDSGVEDDDLLSQRVRRLNLQIAVEVGEVLCPANSRVHTVN
mmetsp:Transcript_24138/g.42869  ORF Transcript_24138/g.42869 Transcript_24138/m.42869 type:complete len:411 (-) Transcript_24138:747-1979(-)